MNKQQLANKIWEAANKLRSKIEANEYKDYILGFIFYKYLSEKEEAFVKNELGASVSDLQEVEPDDETAMEIINSIGYFIKYENLFSVWYEGKVVTPDIAIIRAAINDFDDSVKLGPNKALFDKIFDTLRNGLSKLGDSGSASSKACVNLINLVSDIPMDEQDYDVLGFIYEYLISKFAANAGKKAGEFYTPHEVSVLMSEIIAHTLKQRDTIQIYDPTSGSGSLLINIGKAVEKYGDTSPDRIKYFAQELKENTYNITRMNLVMRGIKPINIVTRCADTLADDWPIEDYTPLYVDAVVSNPPYSQNWDNENKDTDPRYARYGVAPAGKADYAFLLHDLYHIRPDGLMTIVLPHGVLFRGDAEGEIRKNLIETNHIDAIIGLPANIFFGTSIPTIIMVLKQQRTSDDVLIIDASKGFKKEGKQNVLRACDIKKIVDTYIERKTIDKYSKVVTREEIRANDYNLNILRYVDSSDENESWDIYASMFGGIPTKELNTFNNMWNAIPGLRTELFKPSNDEYEQVLVKDIKQDIKNNHLITDFSNNFKSLFSDFGEYLAQKLLTDVNSVNVATLENEIGYEIFNRLKTVSIVDKYVAYQKLDDIWTTIANDIEMIATEGFTAACSIEDIEKESKKNGKVTMVHDYYEGRIFPFALVQKHKLKDKLDALNTLNDKQESLNSEIAEIVDGISDDDKSSLSELFNDDNSAFSNKELKDYVKKIKKEKKSSLSDRDSVDSKLALAASLVESVAKLNKDIKAKKVELEELTISTIKHLSDDEIIELLRYKWISPLVDSILSIPTELISDFASKIAHIVDKYKDTLDDVEKEIKSTESELCTMLDDLVGSDADMKGLAELKAILNGGV